MIWNIASLARSGFNPLINGIVSTISNTTLFLAALIHSGIFPFDFESRTTPVVRSSDLLNNLFIVLNFIVSFSFIANLQAPELPFVLSLTISVVSYLLIIYSSIQWAFIKDKTFSLQFLLLFESGVFIFLYLYGAAQYITYILALLAILILWLALFTHRSKRLSIFPVISSLLITGLPLSLTAFGPRGFIGDGISVGLLVFIFSQILFIIGYIRRAFDGNEKFNQLDKWYQVAYLVGLFLPFLSAAAIIFNMRTTLTVEFGYWWIGSVVVLLAVAGYLFSGKIASQRNPENPMSYSRSLLFLQFISFEWLFNAFSFIENKVRGFINGFSGLMEGEGGIIWALVLLILIFSMLI